MDQEKEGEVRLSQEDIAMIRENNEILRKMRRGQVIGMWLKVLWVAIIIGLPIVLYFYILEPYLQDLQSTYQSFQGETGSFDAILDAFEQYQR